MADFPATIYNQRTIENLPGIIYDADNTKTLFAEDFRFVGDEVNAIESTLGANPQGGESTVGERIATVESEVADIPGDITAAIAAVKAALYPIGSIYTNASDSTNPGTLLGFGTWSAFAAGRVLAGKAASGTFGTIGATGGAETHTLITAEMPAHTHALYYQANVRQTGTSSHDVGAGALPAGEVTQSTGGGGAHNNLQPYIVVYMWRRTA